MTTLSAVHHTQKSQQNHKQNRTNTADTTELTSTVAHFIQHISNNPTCNTTNLIHNSPHQHASPMQRNNDNHQATALENSPTNNKSNTPYNTNPDIISEYYPSDIHTNTPHDHKTTLPNIMQSSIHLNIIHPDHNKKTHKTTEATGKYFHESIDLSATIPSIHNHMEEDSPHPPHTSKQAPQAPLTS